MGNTLTQIDTKVVKNLAVSSDSTTYSSAVRYAKINNVIKRVCDGRVVDILAYASGVKKTISWGDLRFLRKRTEIRDVAPITITDTEITSATTTINTSSTTDFPTAWSGYIGWSVFARTGKTASTLTWVTGIEWKHKKWAKIMIANKLPTDCAKPVELFYVGENGELAPTDYIDYKSQDYVENNYRTVIGDSTASSQYALLYFQEQSRQYWLYYFATPTTLSSWSHTTEIPDDYGEQLIALLVSWELLRETEKRDQGRNQLVLAYAMLEEFYDKFIEQKKAFRKKLRTRPNTHGHVYQRKYT